LTQLALFNNNLVDQKLNRKGQATA